jgi:hypothetical protein
MRNRGIHIGLVGKSEGKIQQGRTGLSWVGSIIIDLREIEWSGMDWFNLAQGKDQRRALVNTAMILLVP